MDACRIDALTADRHAHRRVSLEEETVKLRSQNVKSRDANDDAGRCAFWAQNTNLRWVHMLSHHVAVICTMEFTSAVARWCIMLDSRPASTEDHWKRFFSLLSHRAGVSGSDPIFAVTVTGPVPAAAP